MQVQLVVDLATMAGLADHPAELPGYGPIPAQVVRETRRLWQLTRGPDGTSSWTSRTGRTYQTPRPPTLDNPDPPDAADSADPPEQSPDPPGDPGDAQDGPLNTADDPPPF